MTLYRAIYFQKINDIADVGITIHTFTNTNIQLCDVKFASLICVRKGIYHNRPFTHTQQEIENSRRKKDARPKHYPQL